METTSCRKEWRHLLLFCLVAVGILLLDLTAPGVDGNAVGEGPSVLAGDVPVILKASRTGADFHRGVLPGESSASSLCELHPGVALLLFKPIDLNKAAPGALMHIDGVGESLSGRIVTERSARRGFSAMSDLLEISGIGPAKLAAIREKGIVCQSDIRTD